MPRRRRRFERGAQRVELGRKLRAAAVCDRPGADRERAPAPGAHLLRDGGLIVLGKVARLARVGERARARASALLEPEEALSRIGDEARLSHLAVAHDVEPRRRLLPDAACDRFAHVRRIGRLIDRLAIHSRQHQLEEIIRSRQAADMCGQDTIGAQLHATAATMFEAPPYQLPCAASLSFRCVCQLELHARIARFAVVRYSFFRFDGSTEPPC